MDSENTVLTLELSEACKKEIGDRAVRYVMACLAFERAQAHGDTAGQLKALTEKIFTCLDNEHVAVLRQGHAELRKLYAIQQRKGLFWWLGSLRETARTGETPKAYEPLGAVEVKSNVRVIR